MNDGRSSASIAEWASNCYHELYCMWQESQDRRPYPNPPTRTGLLIHWIYLTRRCFAPSLTLCLILRPKLQPLKHTVTVVKGLLGKLKSLGRQPLNFRLVRLSLYQLCLDQFCYRISPRMVQKRTETRKLKEPYLEIDSSVIRSQESFLNYLDNISIDLPSSMIWQLHDSGYTSYQISAKILTI